MKTLLMWTVILAAAAPAAAIDQGQCCSSVNGVCITRCTRSGGCTGTGDCSLALTSADAGGVDASSPQFKRALRTLRKNDQARLQRLVAQSKPQGNRPPPPPEPIQELAMCIGESVLTLAQLGGTTGKVPLIHGSCGLDCATHVLPPASGALEVSFKLDVSCPHGVVDQVWVQPQGQRLAKVVNAPTGNADFSQTLKLQPFSKAELERACQKALGGSWPLPGSHKNSGKTVQTKVTDAIQVWGRCSTCPANTMQSFPVALTLTCEDQSF